MDCVPTFSRTLRFSLTRLCGFLILSLLFLPETGLSGQNATEKVLEFLDGASGFNLLGEIHEGALATGQSLAITVPLLAGADYMVVGYCNDECTNLDLALFDSAGEEIQSDRLPDSEPVLMLSAEETGQYFIQVNAVQCPVDGCEIAVGILGSTEEPGVGPGEDMAGRLTLVGSELISMGFSRVEDERRGSLFTDQATTFPLTLQGGLEYRIVGVCDKDCMDLDLALLDPAGEEAASDFLDDALPIMAHLPDTLTEYQVEVIMVACAIEPCGYRIATFAKAGDRGFAETTFSGEMIYQETLRGELESGDEQLSGAYLDVYQVEARAGQRIVVDLRSDDFDTLVRLFDPEGIGEENDDYGYETGHSHIELLTLQDGTYSIQVTSFEAFSSGSYVLQIAVVE